MIADDTGAALEHLAAQTTGDDATHLHDALEHTNALAQQHNHILAAVLERLTDLTTTQGATLDHLATQGATLDHLATQTTDNGGTTHVPDTLEPANAAAQPHDHVLAAVLEQLADLTASQNATLEHTAGLAQQQNELLGLVLHELGELTTVISDLRTRSEERLAFASALASVPEPGAIDAAHEALLSDLELSSRGPTPAHDPEPEPEPISWDSTRGGR